MEPLRYRSPRRPQAPTTPMSQLVRNLLDEIRYREALLKQIARTQNAAKLKSLMTDEFLSQYTLFRDFPEWLEAFEKETQTPVEEYSSSDPSAKEKLDLFVRRTSDFSSYEDMIRGAIEFLVTPAPSRRPMYPYSPQWLSRPRRSRLAPQKSTTVNRSMGVIMIVGAIPEALAGASLTAFPEPVTTVVGLVVLFHAVDTAYAGFLMVATGEEHETLTSQSTQLAAEYAGASRKTARLAGDAVDLSLGLFAPGGGLRHAQRHLYKHELEFLTDPQLRRYFGATSAKYLGFTDVFEPKGVHPQKLQSWASEVGRQGGEPTIAVGRRGRYAISGGTQNLTVPNEMWDELGNNIVRSDALQIRNAIGVELGLRYPPRRIPLELHAEPKIIADAPGVRAMTVSKESCNSCLQTAMLKANKTGVRQLIDVPEGVYVIEPGMAPTEALQRILSKADFAKLMSQHSAAPQVLKQIHLPSQYARQTPGYVKLMLVPITGKELRHAVSYARRQAAGVGGHSTNGPTIALPPSDMLFDPAAANRSLLAPSNPQTSPF